jgi:uncharacterized membrane protein YoaK (UPF0700 family)
MRSDSETQYGTLSPGNNGQASHPSDEENAPLLGHGKASTMSVHHRFNSYMMEELDPRHGDLVLILCYSITGLLDSSSISIWSSFVSMQTGNTVYLGLGLADPNGGTRWIKAATSLSSFAVGSFTFARYHRAFSERRRWTMVSAHLLQTLLIVAAAIIVMYDATSTDGNPLRWQVVLPIVLVAFQASGQAITSRALEFNALTSVVLTSIYCDLFSDADLFAGLTRNVKRNQRAAAPIALLIGVLGGGMWAKSDFGMAGALWTAAVLKALIVCGWLRWRGQKVVENEI